MTGWVEGGVFIRLMAAFTSDMAVLRGGFHNDLHARRSQVEAVGFNLMTNDSENVCVCQR